MRERGHVCGALDLGQHHPSHTDLLDEGEIGSMVGRVRGVDPHDRALDVQGAVARHPA